MNIEKQKDSNKDTFRNIECLFNVFCGLFNTTDRNKIKKEDFFNDILNDTGNGIISKGMILLELISSCIRRNNSSALQLLKLPNDTPLTSFINNKNIREEDKPTVTIKCLGIEKLEETLKHRFPERYEIFNKVMADIYDRVSDGSFRRSNHRALMPYLINCTIKCKLEEKMDNTRVQQ